jgi:cytochrome c oxidase cbb3-type subunit 3/ubiquinol-cytochrome c reductase cytochrome c subunit
MKLALALATFLAIASCEAPGRRSVDSPVVPPDQVKDFTFLYAHNCAGCHGPNGRGGVAVELRNPAYLAIADDAAIRRVAAEGRPGTAMAAFAQKYGGLLTDAQIDVIVNGIRTHWANPEIPGQPKPPAYETQSPGDPKRGEIVYNANCSSCHGVNGRPGPMGSIVDQSFLMLVSNQYLRTTILAGIPTLGMPNWRAHPKPLTDDDVTDVVAWLATQRTPFPGQPYLTGAYLSGGVR